MALYSDFDLSLTTDPRTNDLTVLEDEAAVIQSVRALLLTMNFERPFQPSLGSILQKLVFEPQDEVTKLLLAQTIKDTINLHEPRVVLRFVDIYVEEQTLMVDIGFFVLNRPDIVVSTVALYRLR